MRISEDQIDALKETLNISAGQSATALSNLLGCIVYMNVPEIKIMDVDELKDFLSEETRSYISFFSSFERNFTGKILVSYEEDQKIKFVNTILKNFNLELDEENVLVEVSNIIFGSFVAGISNFIGISITFSPPKIVESFDDILSIGNSVALVGEVLLRPAINGEIRAKILLIPSNESVALLLDKLRKMTE